MYAKHPKRLYHMALVLHSLVLALFLFVCCILCCPTLIQYSREELLNTGKSTGQLLFLHFSSSRKVFLNVLLNVISIRRKDLLATVGWLSICGESFTSQCNYMASGVFDCA